ncbi:MAG: TIR domain-containing protein [Chloroflexi bacterium]|nr:MAG: TIR domain-containing protein [Chloroflexota bacterium]
MLFHREPPFSGEVSEAMIDRAGQYIGNYRLLRLLGQGGFAQVYLGEHRYLKSVAALKMLQHSLSEQKEQYFLEEAQTLVGLRHAHIVRVLDFAVERGMAVLVMDYIPKGTLRQRHPRGTRLPLDMTVEYVKQVACALQYAHNHHVIHRDVKPENILLDANDHLVLSDFGLALFAPAPDLLSTQALAGTIPYISPEQARGKPYFASDQYALGVLTYEWLAGVRPFEGSPWELIEQHLTATPPPLREYCPELPASVEQVVLRALAKDPQDRYVSVSAFAQALERAHRESRLDDDDSQKTAPLLATPRSSLVVQTPRTIFLSAAPSDELVAKRLATDLKRQGLLLSNDLPAGTDQEDTMRQAMRAAQRVVVVVTPRTRSSRVVREHLRLAQVYQRKPVLVWMEGDEMVAMLLDHTWEQLHPIDVIDVRGDRYEVALEELLACLREDTYMSSDEEATFSTAAGGNARNPYKGLRAFRQEDALDFFGRDALLEEVIVQLSSMLTSQPRRTAGWRLLTMVGPSGSGKSSVVLAGLLPRLQAGVLPGSEVWVYLEPIVPGTHPIEALALTLAPHFPGRSMKTLCEDLQDDSARGLHWLAMQLVKESGRRLVLVIDQFEELFTQAIAEEDRRRFIELLVTAVTEVQGPVLVILTLRADFSDRPMRYPTFARLIEAHRQIVLPMEIHELHEVIEGPASLPDVQLTFEGNLAGDLLFEAQGQVGALPLLQFTLDQLFQRRDEHILTIAAYQAIGGVKGALVMHAEATYATLPSEEHQRFAPTLFLRLIDPGMSEQDATRRRAVLSELSLPDAAQTSILHETTDAFITARLLTTNENAGTTTVEVSHDALIREWPRLSSWIREAREDIPLQQTLSSDAAAWEQRNRPKDRLYRGSQLKEAQAWAKRNTLSQNEARFLRRASVAHQVRFVINVILIVILIASTTGVAGWFLWTWLLVQVSVLTHVPVKAVVTNVHNHGLGSLLWSINSAPSGSTITFDKSLWGQTIELTDDLPIANKRLSIRGPGAKLLTIHSNHGIILSPDAVVDISGLTFTGTKSNTESLFDNAGTLTITNSTIADNTIIAQFSYGAGIYNRGTLTLTNSTVSGNTASGQMGHGGGIYNRGLATITNSTITNNTASYEAGGIYNFTASKLTITNSTIASNTAAGSDGDGGGITNAGELTITNSTISGNTATGPQSDGGGISNGNTTRVTLINSTISGNRSSLMGGAISCFGCQIAIEFSTIYGNQTGGNGGSLFIQDSKDTNGTVIQSHVSLRNSIVVGNSSKIGPNIAGKFTSNGYNLLQDLSATFPPQSTDVLLSANADLKIDAVLRDNGGLTTPHTFTHALLPGSPAINAIPLDACHIDGISTDQRGMRRPDAQNYGCDIGAYESTG